MSECIDHMDAYTNLTDSVFHLILMSEINNEYMKRAKEILDNIQRRRLYKCVGESVPFTEANPLKKSVSSRNDNLCWRIQQMNISMTAIA